MLTKTACNGEKWQPRRETRTQCSQTRRGHRRSLQKSPRNPPHDAHAQRRDHVPKSKTAAQTQPNVPQANNATGNGNHYATVATSEARSAAYTKNL